MIDKIHQQIEFAQSRLGQATDEDNQHEMLQWKGYIQGLRYVLGLMGSRDPKTEKSDDHFNRGEL